MSRHVAPRAARPGAGLRSRLLAGVRAAGLGARPAPPVAALAVFVASLPGIALGAAMTLATEPWYSSYPSLADQQVAGAVMLLIGTPLVIAAVSVLFFKQMGRDAGE